VTKSTSTGARTFRTSVSIPADARAKLCALLNQNLADAADMHGHAKQAHWNVKGATFWQLHKLFDEIAGEATEWVDLYAERVTALGGYATGTVRMAAEASRLPEFPAEITDGQDYVRAVAERLAAFTNAAREAIDAADTLGDMDTADLFTEVSRSADKYLYFLEAHLQA
jgi:starvation-inducible DNA-binding protein